MEESDATLFLAGGSMLFHLTKGRIRPFVSIGAGLIVASALTYAVGGVVYARRRPDPWPAWLGFHEVFHALVVLGSTVHVVAVWRYVLPLA